MTAKRGRSTLLTPFIYKAIVKAVEQGNWTTTAARSVGIEPRRMQKWLQRGRGDHPRAKPKEPYISFANDIEAAIAKAEANLVQELREQEDWRAKAWLLERGPARERWSPNVTVSAQLAPAVSILDTLRSRAAAIEGGDEIEPLQLAEPVETKAEVKQESSNAKSR